MDRGVGRRQPRCYAPDRDTQTNASIMILLFYLLLFVPHQTATSLTPQTKLLPTDGSFLKRCLQALKKKKTLSFSTHGSRLHQTLIPCLCFWITFSHHVPWRPAEGSLDANWMTNRCAHVLLVMVGDLISRPTETRLRCGRRVSMCNKQRGNLLLLLTVMNNADTIMIIHDHTVG